MKFGTTDIQDCKLGTTPIVEVRRGTELIWPEAQPVADNFTLIGGVAANFPTASDLAVQLSIAASDISDYTIVGNNIKCKINASYAISDNAFYNVPITFYFDGGNCTSIGSYAFGNRDNFLVARFSESTSAIGTVWLSNGVVKRIYIPKVTDLGGTTGEDDTFQMINPSVTIYANPALQTNNNGGEDGDIVEARGRGATIVYVTDFTKPSSITDLSYSGGTLNFTAPTAVNGISFYEVYVNGFYSQDISGSGTAITFNSGDVVEVYACDSFYNRSKSNQITI